MKGFAWAARVFWSVCLCCCLCAQCMATDYEDSPEPIPILLIRSSNNAFYDPTQKGFLQSLKRQEQMLNISAKVNIISLSGSQDTDQKMIEQALNQHPQLIVTLGTDATIETSAVHPDVPVLFTLVLNPVALGVVKSLDAPGTNFSGTTLLVSPGKQLEALLQVDPQVSRVGAIYTQGDPVSQAFLEAAQSDAQQLHITLVTIAVKSGDPPSTALQSLDGKVDALWTIADPASSGPQALQATLAYAHAHNLPVLGLSGATVHEGALLALFPDLEDEGALTAEMAGYLLSGSQKIEQLRVRGPRKVLLCINLDVARALKIKVPNDVLHLADEVVDSER
ncbi:ABC transporter substrate-binding protein [Chthonomonas calidirosea]|nr:ABC transporter substrate-binding protein [Chthonomonas calidirosea]